MTAPEGCVAWVADGLAELEVQGDKELKVRFYNIEDALDEKSWIAGIISETFGRKVGPLYSLLLAGMAGRAASACRYPLHCVL